MRAEIAAFSDMLDEAYAIQYTLHQELGVKPPTHRMTDSESLFDVISKGSRASKRKLKVDIAASREAYEHKKKNNIGFIREKNNIADGLKRLNESDAIQSI